jgi:hypothetical protein
MCRRKKSVILGMLTDGGYWRGFSNPSCFGNTPSIVECQGHGWT